MAKQKKNYSQIKTTPVWKVNILDDFLEIHYCLFLHLKKKKKKNGGGKEGAREKIQCELKGEKRVEGVGRGEVEEEKLKGRRKKNRFLILFILLIISGTVSNERRINYPSLYRIFVLFFSLPMGSL